MEPHPPSVEVRLAHLEARVAELDAEVTALRAQRFAAAPVPSSATSGPAASARRPAVQPAGRAPRRWAVRAPDLASGDWLARIGIGLLLLGVVFLLKYSIDQGWIGPGVRVAMGAVVGAGLVAVGWMLRTRRAALASVLQGGGVAALYGSLFAAFQLYGLIGYTTAFGLMVVVTAVGFALAVLGRNEALSVVAVLGGLGTPFLLTREPGTLVGLMTYTLIVLAGGSAVYARFKWRSLLVSMALGGAFVVSIAALFSLPAAAPLAETLAFQVGVLAVWTVTTLLPLMGRKDAAAFSSTESLLTVAAALGVLAGTAHAWQMTNAHAGMLALALMAGYGAAYGRQRRHTLLADALLVSAALLLAAGGVLLLNGAWTLVGPALAGLLLLRLRPDPPGALSLVAAGLFGSVTLGAWMVLLDTSPGLAPLLDADVYGLLLTVGLMGLAAYAAGRLRVVLAVTAYTLFLGWQVYLFSDVPGGGAWASVGWGVTGVVAVVWGLRTGAVAVRLWGFATLVVAIGKLLLFDLPDLGTLARTLLFLGAGVVLLLVSYFVPNLLRREASEADQATPLDG